MNRYEIFIGRWFPPRLNQFIHRPWQVGHRLKKAARQLVAVYAHSLDIPRATGKRRVSLRLALPPRQRAFDPDSLHKGLLDALVACELLIDDNPKHCVLGPVEYDRGQDWGTLIILEDVE